MPAPVPWSTRMAAISRQRGRSARLPGIGDYTAAAIAAIAFDRRAAAVDANVERVIARLFAVDDAAAGRQARDPPAGGSDHARARAGDFAQAMMDLGATICTPKTPGLRLCPVGLRPAPPMRAATRKHFRGEDAETRPEHCAKARPSSRGGRMAACMIRRRPRKGFLEAMTEVPTTQWRHDFDDGQARKGAPRFASMKMQKRMAWRKVAGVVRHVFTHFPLELSVYTADVPARTPAPAGTRWVALASLAGEALPSVMRKVVAHALP